MSEIQCYIWVLISTLSGLFGFMVGKIHERDKEIYHVKSEQRSNC